jgi:predicted ester cyclase
MVISDNQVAVHTTMYGTHTGDFFGIPPTNKKVKVSQMQIERIVNNKISEHWRVTDELTLLKQIGQLG